MSSTFHAVDPSTGEPGAAFEEATRADVHEAVSAAHEAFRAGDDFTFLLTDFRARFGVGGKVE